MILTRIDCDNARTYLLRVGGVGDNEPVAMSHDRQLSLEQRAPVFGFLSESGGDDQKQSENQKERFLHDDLHPTLEPMLSGPCKRTATNRVVERLKGCD